MSKKEKLENTLESVVRLLHSEIKTSKSFIEWYFCNKLHRDFDKPAMIFNDGSKVWAQYGHYHRDHDKPTIIWNNGPNRVSDLEYYQHGKKIK